VALGGKHNVEESIMEDKIIEFDSELQRIIWACYEYWKNEILPPDNRSICFSWVLRLYTKRFGGKFHQSKLRELVRLGVLEKDDTSRAGKRRYYRIINPTRIESILKAGTSGALST